jgi:hypothetical protein
MATVRTLACVLAVSVLPLVGGCGDSSEKRVEDQEPESIREERRMKHEKLAPKDVRPTDAGTVKK